MDDPTAVRTQGARPTSVYLYYDQFDVLLYVGITSRGTRRQGEHNRSKEWWPLVARQEVEHFPDRALAAQREAEVIRTVEPPYNVQGNPRYRERRITYERLRERLLETSVVVPVELAKAVGKRLALTPITGGFTFDPIYRPVVSRLAGPSAPLKIVTDSGRNVGKALHIEREGPFYVLKASVRPEFIGMPGVARFKIITAKDRDGGPTFEVVKVVVPTKVAT